MLTTITTVSSQLMTLFFMSLSPLCKFFVDVRGWAGMRQHPRPTYGKARGQWPPQLDKGDSSAQFHGADGKRTAPQLDSRVFRTASLCMAACQPGKGNIFHAGHEKRDRVHSVPRK